jgi:hypothetical protein
VRAEQNFHLQVASPTPTPWRVVREKSQPGRIWLRSVSLSVALWFLSLPLTAHIRLQTCSRFAVKILGKRGAFRTQSPASHTTPLAIALHVPSMQSATRPLSCVPSL